MIDPDAIVELLRLKLAGTQTTDSEGTVAALLPGPAAQLTMAPGYRRELTRTGVRDRKCTEAAVLILILPAGELVLTVRHGHLKHHAGQVSFPGGRREPGESLLDTAIRECREEVGVGAGEIEVLGRLTPLYIPPTRFCVHPFVATAATTALRPNPAEVARIVTVPVHELLDPAVRQTQKRVFQEHEYDVPYFAIGGEVVWGATAMMLAEFRDLFSESGSPFSPAT